MSDPIGTSWRAGSGVIRHTEETIARMDALLDHLVQAGTLPSREAGLELLAAADRLANQTMWLVVHMTYAQRVHTDGRALEADDFKPNPEGHTGGALNMAIAYVGYLLANALSGHTRAWLMEQGHCVAAIDAANILVGNSGAAHARRYRSDDAGLTALVQDFYGYAIDAAGRPAAPLGSHVNAHTAGGIMEGGYLGFAGLQYVHMPLPGQRLVAFLSDGAFEEQRGPDWAPRWWRAEDSGLVLPVMIANGRRIDQRTTLSQSGGTDWFEQHLRLNHFAPVVIDGRDPAAFAWAILTQEQALEQAAARVAAGDAQYPVPLPYVIAETQKGFGFPGAGSNSAHNLPLPGNPHRDAKARELFNEAAQHLFVPMADLQDAVAALNNHDATGRVRERDHALADIRVPPPRVPDLPWREVGAVVQPMAALDQTFVALVQANPRLRPRVGNPDELRSNRCNATLDLLKHRVTAPEPGIAEAIDGAVITALNEEAVACAVLGNKQGINLLVSYEAFAAKMLGSLRQEIIFSRHCKEAGRTPGWRSVPLVVTSHTWENGKNEQSHQDPVVAEALLGEMGDVSRVLFPIDGNSAIAALADVYAGCGAIATLVVPKNDLPVRLDADRARTLLAKGLLCVDGDPQAPLQLLAIGAYQLEQALAASRRLRERGEAASVWAIVEPGRLRRPRDEWEQDYTVDASRQLAAAEQRVFICHTRPEPMLGVLRPLDLGAGRTVALGYCNRGGTLDPFGMLFANGCTWAHGLAALADMRGNALGEWLDPEEVAAVEGRGDPLVLKRQLV